jgi:hypothetical protein
MADYTLIKIPELTSAAVIADADLLVIETSAGTRHIPFSALKGSIPNYGYISDIFTSADLSANILTITHAKNTRKIRITVWDPSGVQQLVTPYIIDVNNIAINFGGDIGGGDWEYLIEYWTAGGSASYPDTTYELAQTKQLLTLNTTTKNAALTVNSSRVYQDNNLVAVSLQITTSSVFAETGGGATLGTLSVAPAAVIYFPGAIKKVSYYESAWGYLSNTGEIKLFFGKANETYMFNFTYPIL